MKSKKLLLTFLLALLVQWAEANTSYEYQVRDYCVKPDSASLNVVPSFASATVTWAGVQDSYIVYWGDCNNNVTNYTHQATVAGTIYTIEGLASGQHYGVKIEGICGEGQVSEAIETQFTTAMSWTDPDTWQGSGIPQVGQSVTIPDNTIVVIPSGCGTIVVNEINMGEGSQLIIEEGAELVYAVSDPVYPEVFSQGVGVTMSMNISGQTRDNSGYRLIASPIYETIDVEACGLTENYDGMDLYSFDANYPQAEWRNYKTNDNFSNLQIGKGYLYYNTEATFVTFFGQTIPSNVIYLIDLDWSPNAYYDEWKGFNLVGNPFTCTAYPNRDYYVLNSDGNEVVATDKTVGVGPMKGFFVLAESQGDQCQMRKTPVNTQPSLNMTLSQDQNLVDAAIVNFGKGDNLRKVQLNPNHTKIYMPLGSNDYASMYAEEQGEMPVNFKAEHNGNYTLSFNNVNVEFSYLRLIDNLTGVETNLLATPSYTFSAKSTDYANRFRLVYATGSSVDGESFAFINGAGDLSIYGIEGIATVEVMDLTGRIISSETFNGSYEKQLNVAPGVYMLRLINGNDVKVQKMIVR